MIPFVAFMYLYGLMIYKSLKRDTHPTVRAFSIIGSILFTAGIVFIVHYLLDEYPY